MKKFCFSLLILLFSLDLYAQWGVKVGANTSTITGSDVRNYSFSGHFGGFYDIKLSNKWYLKPELLFTSIGYKLKSDGVIVKNGHITIYALELPINISYQPSIVNDIKLIIDFGFYVRYGLFGNKIYNYFNTPRISETPFNAYNRFDSGLNIGLGIQKNHYFGIISFQRGFSAAEKAGNGYHQVFKISLGYKF